MKSLHAFTVLLLSSLAISSQLPGQNDQYQALKSHFERVINARFDTLFSSIGNIEQWEIRKERSGLELGRMLWHDRSWPDSPPPVEITRRVENPDYTLECLILETAPQVYSTANLYLPRSGRKPFPVVLYQCGHANKRIFKHHGAWFAARGIAVLIMDNIEMGEIEFTHHGVYAHAWFHWYSRGFSPMAVEMLNARRCLDYLCSRPDIDRSRIGATGVSGGGMATFFLAALDQRVKASAPVSGALSSRGWIMHSLSSAHCDCQYPVNSYGLLYSEIGALTAPRAQLLCNASADRGFPMDSFDEMVDKMREIYRLYGADDNLRTAVVPGGHGDNEVIRLPVYAFFLKEFLGKDTTITEQGPVNTLPDEQLTCWQSGYPLTERLSRIDEELIPAHKFLPYTLSGHSREARISELTGQLRDEVFRYFPEKAAPLEPVWGDKKILQSRAVQSVSFNSFAELRVRGIYSLPTVSASRTRMPAVLLVDHRRGIPVWGNEQLLEGNRWGDRAVLVVETLDRGRRALEENLRSFNDNDLVHHMRRQAMVAGTTLNSMEVYEILRALEFLRARPEVDPDDITIIGKGEVGINGLYAGLLDGARERVILESPPSSHRQGPCYLGILKFTDIPEVIGLMSEKVRIYGEVPLELELFLEKSGLDNSVLSESLLDCLAKSR